MANALFDAARAVFLGAGTRIDWDADVIKLVLVDHGVDTPVPATDDFLDDILAGARIATSAAFTTKTTTAGVADADDVTLTAVSGASVESIVIFDDTPATEATKNLIAFIDTATGLPFTPSGGDVTIQWDNGANKIFKL
jgi:hypothetical protein